MKALATKAGVTDGYISQLENGQKPAPKEKAFYKIIDALFDALEGKVLYPDILLEFSKETLYDNHINEYLDFAFKQIFWKMINYSQENNCSDILIKELINAFPQKATIKHFLIKKMKFTHTWLTKYNSEYIVTLFKYLRSQFACLKSNEKKVLISRYLLGFEYTFDMDHLWIHSLEDPTIIKQYHKRSSKEKMKIFENFGVYLGW